MYFQHCTFQGHVFNTSLLSILFLAILKYVQHYQQYLIFLLNSIVVKTRLLKPVRLFTTVLEFLNSCSCDAMTNLACFIFFFYFILTQLICCLFFTVTPSYIQEKISTVVYLTLLIEQMVMS